MKQSCAVSRAATHASRIKRVPSRGRCFSHGRTISAERVVVPCRSDGTITLDVQPPASASGNQDAIPKMIIHLPRGPFNANEDEETGTFRQIAHQLPHHHIIRINYRLSAQDAYPTPIHDVLVGYDWVLQNLLHKRSISRPGRSEHVGRIAVCGELIGGGLAAMLALTECRKGEPGVMASALSNPLVEWVSLSNYSVMAQQQNDTSPKQLLELRQALFTRPDRYFDPLASPILLFRAAGIEVPPAPADTILDDMAQLSLFEREQSIRHSRNIVDEGHPQDEPSQSPSPKSPTSRKSSRRFPSPSLHLKLPEFYISSGSVTPFSNQAEEFTHVLRQSFIRQARHQSDSSKGSSSFGRKVLLAGEQDRFESDDEKALRAEQEADAVRRARLHQHQGLGLWDGSEAGRDRVRQVAAWLGERMQA